MSSKSKKEKTKISKLIEQSDSENDENERELSFYMNDRVKLMKEVLKIIKPKRIKSMAPDCIKDLDIEEINSMLLEELLGISNKRLKYIFTGENLDGDSSSTDPEEEQIVDIISLDDVSDDDFIIEADTSKARKKKHGKIKEESTSKRIKKEKHVNNNKSKGQEPLQENLMSVLELLELQARARAIRSQLLLEASKKSEQVEIKVDGDSDTDDAVIIETPKNDEIVINSTDSETELVADNCVDNEKSETTKNAEPADNDKQRKKITLVRDRLENKSDKLVAAKGCEPPLVDTIPVTTSDATVDMEVRNTIEGSLCSNHMEENKADSEKKDCNNDEDEIILIVDQEEMDGLIGET